MSLATDLAEYHDVVSRAVVVLDKDVADLEGRYEALSSACKNLEARVQSLERSQTPTARAPTNLSLALAIIALFLSLISLLV